MSYNGVVNLRPYPGVIETSETIDVTTIGSLKREYIRQHFLSPSPRCPYCGVLRYTGPEPKCLHCGAPY